jgi:hypothetical protein
MSNLFRATLVLGVVSAGTAFAQTPMNTSPTPPAVSTTGGDSQTTAAPVAGANSFTESEAKGRLQAHGYTDVSALMKDGQSIWRGKATKDGKSVDIAVDFQGNIVPNGR